MLKFIIPNEKYLKSYKEAYNENIINEVKENIFSEPKKEKDIADVRMLEASGMLDKNKVNKILELNNQTHTEVTNYSKPEEKIL